MSDPSIEDQAKELHLRLEQMSHRLNNALRSGIKVVCAECREPVKDKYLLLVYPTQRNTIRECIVHQSCIPNDISKSCLIRPNWE